MSWWWGVTLEAETGDSLGQSLRLLIWRLQSNLHDLELNGRRILAKQNVLRCKVWHRKNWTEACETAPCESGQQQTLCKAIDTCIYYFHLPHNKHVRVHAWLLCYMPQHSAMAPNSKVAMLAILNYSSKTTISAIISKITYFCSGYSKFTTINKDILNFAWLEWHLRHRPMLTTKWGNISTSWIGIHLLEPKQWLKKSTTSTERFST